MSTIWTPEKAGGEETFLRTRKPFRLEEPGAPVWLRCTCSGIYRLWINGVPVAHGPAHSGTSVKRVDALEVSRWLKPGLNLLAFRLIHFDYCTAQGFCPAPAFACSLKGEGVEIESDATWKMALDAAYRLPSFRRNTMYGPQEIYDARLEEDWQTAAYDDSGWVNAVEVDIPWGREIGRGVPFPQMIAMKPCAVVRVAEVLDQEHFPEMWNNRSYQSLAVSLLQDLPEDPVRIHVEGAENLLAQGEGAMTVVQPFIDDPELEELRCATVVFDFGKEITGYTWFEVEGNEGAIIDVVHGETLTAGRVQAMRQGTHYADRYILREGRQRHEIYDWKGFRYVQLTFRNLVRPLGLHGLGATFSSYPVKYRGRLHCGDDLLETIWRTGAYTQQLCMHDRLMDCPWREQVQWLGDGRVQLQIIQNAFGEKAILRKFVEDFAHSQYDSGLVPSMSGKRENNDIMDYALWWVVALHDEAAYEGDREFVRSMLPHVQAVLSFFARHVNGQGLIEAMPGWVLIDWAPLGRSGCIAALNAIYGMALACAEALARWVGREKLAAGWQADEERIRTSFHAVFWSDERQLYRDCVSGGDEMADQVFSRHTQALAVLAGLSQTDPRSLMVRALESKELVGTSPYFSFYLLEALGQVGLGGEALGFIRRKWGRMVEAGATTFWEEWQTGATHRDGYWVARPRSLCHAWSAAPTAWLSRFVLGVRADHLDGVLRFAPQPCGLAGATGAVPVRQGVVEVAWQITDGRFHAELTMPQPDMEVEFHAPEGFEETSTLAVDGCEQVARQAMEPVFL